MKFFRQLLGAGVLTLGMACANAAPDFSRPNNHLGNADKDGAFCLWVAVVTLGLKDGTSLPLRLRFDGGSNPAAPLFGKFWWCPVLESTLVSRDERVLVLTTLGGRENYLVVKKDGTLASEDGRIIGKNVSLSESVVMSDGWEYHYIGGKLHEAKETNGPVDLEWVYQGSRLLSISNKTGGTVLSLEYTAGSSIPSALVADKVRYNLKTQQVPLIAAVAGVSMVAGYAPSLAEIQNNTVNQSFPIRFERDGNYVMDYKSNFWAANTFTWEAVTGVLKSDKTWSYKDTRDENGMLTVSRQNAQGGIESYFYDLKKGLSEYRQLDGSVAMRSYFNSPGPTQNKIRKLITTKDGKQIFDWECSYDEMGRLVRERSDSNKYEKLYGWHEDGTLESETLLSDGKEFEKKVYDTSGRIVDSSRGGRVYHYVYQEGRTLIQKIVNGKVAEVRVPGSAGKAGTFFEVGEGGQLQTPGQHLASSTNSSQSTTDAMAFALRVMSNPVVPKK